MPTRNRIVLGRYQDARIGAERLVGVGSWSSRAECSTSELGFKRMVNAFVARVRRRFGDRYAKVALAYLHDRHWSKTGLPKSTFYYALKKIEKTFDAHKHWAILRSARRKKTRRLD